MKRRTTRGFTLTEVLVVLGIVAVLAAVTTGTVLAMKGKARTAAEIQAAKNLITGYHLAAAELGDVYLPGMDMTENDVTDTNGKRLGTAHAGHRYPYRLAHYIDSGLDGSILLQSNSKQILAMNGGKTTGMYSYLVSAFPALGMNGYLVGGYKQTNGTISYEEECVTRPGRELESHVIVFASAGTMNNGKPVDGYSIITPPNFPAGSWSPKAGDGNPADSGNVSFRHSGKAVCAFLDGSVSVHTRSELRDMRLWSHRARYLGEKNYTLAAGQ